MTSEVLDLNRHRTKLLFKFTSESVRSCKGNGKVLSISEDKFYKNFHFSWTNSTCGHLKYYSVTEVSNSPSVTHLGTHFNNLYMVTEPWCARDNNPLLYRHNWRSNYNCQILYIHLVCARMGRHLLEELQRMWRKYMTISNVINNTTLHYWTNKTHNKD